MYKNNIIKNVIIKQGKMSRGTIVVGNKRKKSE